MDSAISQKPDQGFDIIGDIHGYAEPLKRLLQKMDYEFKGGVWQHPERTAVYVGDFIDRGPHQKEVVTLVRGMVEAGFAQAVMGNHELNAIAWYHGFRPDTEKNRNQHQRFLEEVEHRPDEHREIIDWFTTLPLWLNLNGIRIVHACWHSESIERLDRLLNGNRLNSEALESACRRTDKIGDDHVFEAVEILLKGLEAPLPHGVGFTDKDGAVRNKIRTRWWDPEATTFRQAVVGHGSHFEGLPDTTLPDHLMIKDDADAPIFFGHYWHSGTPIPLRPNAACLDYSVANRGKLCAYRWRGESNLVQNHFEWVEAS